MTPERWQQVERLCLEALTRDTESRAAFLDAECAGDPALRADVDELLRQRSAADHFLSTPAARVRVGPGTRIGAYEIIAPLGAGGMGEVYRANDIHLKRSVAIKVLPAAVAADTDRLARFRREGELLAALNHPNIAGIYGIEKTPELTALVMELVDGQDLSDVIGAGIPLADALPIARQIAEALEAAHERGIIHRDLKPANIKVRADGTVKVLDFGLAKAATPDSGPADIHNSPTMTTPAMTKMGIILGTAAYMAPEQAKGRVVDKRADIWAFGVVLYEMLTGQRAFDGEDVPDLLVAVMSQDVDFARLPAGTPPQLRALIRDCLVRDPKQRLRDIGHARLVIDKIIAGTPDDTISASAVRPPVASAPRRAMPWAAVAIVVLVSAVAAIAWMWRPGPSEGQPLSVEIALGTDATLDPLGATIDGASIDLSRDGQRLVFAALDASGKSHLYIRRLQDLHAEVLPGTEDAASPFFSPDGAAIGFFADGKLKKVSLDGVVTTLCNATVGRGGAWSDDGTIVFTPNTPSGFGLMRVSASGGTPQSVGPMLSGEVTQRWPQMLPGGQAVLYTSHSSVSGFDTANIAVAPMGGGSPAVVLSRGYGARYTSSGHLLFIREGTLFAVAFDPQRLKVSGEPVPVVKGISGNTVIGSPSFAVSAAGMLAYVPGIATSTSRPLFWMDHSGAMTPLRAAPLDWDSPRFSPDGRRLAMTISDGGHENVFVYDPARELLRRLAHEDMHTQGATWAPDGERVAFAADVDGGRNLFWQHADGSGEPMRLTTARHVQVPTSFHPSGKWLAYFEVGTGTGTGMDLMVLPIEGDAKNGWKPGVPVAVAATKANEGVGAFSPDGKWIAYMSDESGRPEVYVQSFPVPGPRTQVSSEGGMYPLWSRSKPELFYEAPGAHIMVAGYRQDTATLTPDKPRLWSPVPFWHPGARWSYDLHPDGQRFVVSKIPEVSSNRRDRVALATAFFTELRRLVPAAR